MGPDFQDVVNFKKQQCKRVRYILCKNAYYLQQCKKVSKSMLHFVYVLEFC